MAEKGLMFQQSPGLRSSNLCRFGGDSVHGLLIENCFWSDCALHVYRLFRLTHNYVSIQGIDEHMKMYIIIIIIIKPQHVSMTLHQTELEKWVVTYYLRIQQRHPRSASDGLVRFPLWLPLVLQWWPWLCLYLCPSLCPAHENTRLNRLIVVCFPNENTRLNRLVAVSFLNENMFFKIDSSLYSTLCPVHENKCV